MTRLNLANLRVAVETATSRSREEEDSRATLDLIEQALKELAGYAQFEKGWDGYRAEPFSLKILLQAQRMIAAIGQYFIRQGITPDEITPGPANDGTLEIEVRYKDRYQLFGLDPESIHISLFKRHGRKSQQESFQLTAWSLESALDWLTF